MSVLLYSNESKSIRVLLVALVGWQTVPAQIWHRYILFYHPTTTVRPLVTGRLLCMFSTTSILRMIMVSVLHPPTKLPFTLTFTSLLPPMQRLMRMQWLPSLLILTSSLRIATLDGVLKSVTQSRRVSTSLSSSSVV